MLGLRQFVFSQKLENVTRFQGFCNTLKYEKYSPLGVEISFLYHI